MKKRYFTPHEEVLKPLRVQNKANAYIHALALNKLEETDPYNKNSTSAQQDLERFINVLKPQEIIDIIHAGEYYTQMIGPLKDDFKTNNAMRVAYTGIKDLAPQFINKFFINERLFKTPRYETSQELIEHTVALDKEIQMQLMPFRSPVTFKEVTDSYNYFMNAIKPNGKGALIFDFETLAGMKGDKVKAFDTITEFSFLETNAIGTAEEMKQKAVGYLIGIDDELTKRYMSIFSEGKPLVTDGYIDVVARRLALYGNSGTRYHQTARGAYVIDQLAELSDNHIPTKNEILKGIDVLNKAYHADQATLDVTGTHLTETQEKYSHMLKIMFNSDKAISGYNIKRADLIWNNLYIEQLPQETREYMLKYAGLDSSKPLPTSYNERFFDLFQYIRMAQYGTTAAEIYKDQKIDFKNSMFTQETMVNTFLPEIMKQLTSHGATDDVVAYSQLFTNKDFLERFQQGIAHVTERYNMNTPVMKFAPNRQLFLATQNLGMNSPFDFVLTPDNNIHYTSGFGLEFEEALFSDLDNPPKFNYTATNKGLLTDSIGGSIIHKNSLYTIASVGTIKTTPEMRKAAKKIDSDYAQEQLHYIVFQGYDKAGTLSSTSHEVRFYRSQEEMLAQLNLNPVVGMNSAQDPSVRFYEPLDPKKYKEYIDSVSKQIGIVDLAQQKTLRKELLEMKASGKTHTPTGEKIKPNRLHIIQADPNKIIDDALENERTSRVKDVIRTPDFKKVKRMRQLANLISKEEKNPIFKEQIDHLYFEGNLKTGIQVAARFANGKSHTLEVSDYEKIINLIGFDDIQAEHKRLNRSTVDNIFGVSKLYYSNNKILNPVIEYINNMYGEDADAAQLAYEYIINHIQNRLTEDLHYNTEKQVRPITKRVNELNYIEVDRKKLSPQIRKFYKKFDTIADFNNASDYLKITVGEDNDYLKLINSLIIERYHSVTKPGTEDYRMRAYTVLDDLRKYLIKDKELGNIIAKRVKDMTDYSRPEEMASAIIGAIKLAKKQNIMAGIKQTEERVLPVDILENGNNLVADLLEKNPHYFEQIIDELDMNMPNFVKLYKNRTEQASLAISKETAKMHLINPIFKGHKSMQEVFENPFAYARKYGQDEIRANYFQMLIEQAEEDYSKATSDLLSEFGRIPGFQIFTSKKNIYAYYEGQVLDITEKMPYLVSNNGNVSIKLGKQSLSLHGELLGDSQKYNPGSTRFTTNIAKSYRDGWFSWHSAALRALNEGENPLITLDKALSQWGKSLRESSTLDKENINNLHGNYRIGIDDLFKQVLYAEKEGAFKNQVAGHAIDPDVSKVAQRILEFNHGDVPANPYFDATFRQVITKNIYDVLEIVTGYSAFKPEGNSKTPAYKVKKALQLISPFTSEKDAGTGLMGVGHQHAPYSGFARANRITLGQNNFNFFLTHEALIRTAKAYTGEEMSAQKAAEFLKKRGVMIGSVLHNGYTYALEDFKSLDKQMSYQITGNKVLISHQAFHEIIDKQLIREKEQANSITDSVEKGRAERRIEALTKRLKQYSLLEDETIVNPRLYDNIFTTRDMSMFRANNVYQYPDHKEINNLAKTQFHIRRDKAGHFTFSYGEGIEKQAEDILLHDMDKRGERGDMKIASYDGTLKLGFFDYNTKRLITENEINEKISKFKTQKQVNEYIQSLSDNAYFYLEPKESEQYRKSYSNYVEKSKGLSNVFNIGEFNEDLKMRLMNYLSPEQQARYLNRKDSSMKDIEEVLEIIGQKERTGLVNVENLKQALRKNTITYSKNFNARTTQRIDDALEQIKLNFAITGRKLTSAEETILNHKGQLKRSDLTNIYGFLKKAYKDISSINSDNYVNSLRKKIQTEFAIDKMDISTYPDRFIKQIYAYLGDNRGLLKQIQNSQQITREQANKILKILKAKTDTALDKEQGERVYRYFERTLNRGFTRKFNKDNLDKFAEEYKDYLTESQMTWLASKDHLNEAQIEKFFRYIKTNHYIADYNKQKKLISSLIQEQETDYHSYINYKNLPKEVIDMLYSHLSAENQRKWDKIDVVSPTQFKEFVKAMENDVSQANAEILNHSQKVVSQYRKELNDERNAAFDFIQDAVLKMLHKKGYDPGDIMQFTSENNPKHGDISKNMSETFLTLQTLRQRAFGETEQEATEKVVDFLKSYMPGMDRKNIKANGKLVLPDNYELEEYKYEALVKAINEHPEYKNFFAPGNIIGIPIYDDSGNLLAALSVSQLAQAKEYEYATYAMPVDSTPEIHRLNASKQEVEEEIKKAKNKIKALKNKLNTRGTLNKEDIEQIKTDISKLSLEIKGHKETIKEIMDEVYAYKRVYAEKAKGMSFGYREKLAFRSQVIDEDIFTALKTRMSQLGELKIFDETFGDLMDAEGKFKGDKNKPIFSAVLSHISHAQQTETAYETLVNNKTYKYLIDKHFASPTIRKHVKSFYEGLEKTKNMPLTVESLERAYFANQAKLAFDFNTHNFTGPNLVKSMEELGFERITLNDLSITGPDEAKAFEIHGNSPFSKNLLLDFQDGDFIAIPYLPHTSYKNDIVQKQYQAHWHRLREAYTDMEEARRNNNKVAYTHAKELFDIRKESLKQAITTIAYGKEGVMNKDVLNYRAPYSMATKASTAYLDYYGFDNSYYKGKSLREWTNEKVYIDAAFANEKAFKKMGILNQDYLDSLKDVDFSVYNPKTHQNEILSYAGQDVTEEMLRKKLEVEGIDVFSNRFPTNMEGSLTPTKLYLDPHMNNSENRTRLAYWTQLAKNGDNDGDTTFFSLAMFRDAVSGKSFDTYHSKIYKRDFDKGVMLRAVSTNAVYADEAAMKVQKTYETLVRDHFEDTYKKLALDGDFLSTFTDNPYSHYTEEETQQMFDTINQIEKEMGEKIDPSDLSKTNEFLAAKKALTKSVDGNVPELSEEAYNMMKKSIQFKVGFANIQLAGVAKVRGKGGAIGEIDMLSATLRGQAEFLYKHDALTKTEYEGINMISFLLTQRTISGKKNSDIENVKTIQEFRDILNKAHDPKRVPEINNLEETARTFLENNILVDDVSLGESIALSLRRLNGEEISNKQARDDAIDAVIKMLPKLNTDTMRNHRNYLEIYKKMQPRKNIIEGGLNGIHIQTLDDGTPLDYIDYLNSILLDANPDLFKKLNENGVKFANEALASQTDVSEQFLKQLNNSSKRMVVEQSGSIFENLAKPLDSKIVIGGALGLAAAYMITGFMGNNPSTPATTQSQIMSDEEQEQQTPILSDYGTDFEYPHQPQGYVINVNADNGLNSKKTQRVIETMATSISHSINTDVNINMRIQEDTNFDNYTLNRMLTRAFGLQ